ncbi:MAG: M20/M25/M40 family metallo-hydrolase [Pyrinomonadaceae bacterium]
MKNILLVNVLFVLASIVAGQPTQPTGEAPAARDPFSPKALVEESIKNVPCKIPERKDGVKKLFLEAGALENDITFETFDKDKAANVVVRKSGKSKETIVIGAHYDRTSTGCGVTDNWSGVSIIAHIYRTIRGMDTEKSYVFAAFDREEEGLKGSREMVKGMSEADRANVCSMVNFDSFGQGYPMALRNASSSKMVKFAEDFAKESKINFTAVAIEGASSDSASFVEKKIPAITLSGLSSNWQEILHSSNDKVEKVNMDSVYMGYRFGVVFVSKLDGLPCGEFRKD